MMLLFCAGVGVLLAGSYFVFYAFLARVIRAQFDRRVLEAVRPVAADSLADQDLKDIKELNLPGQYFELLEPSGRVVAMSKNLQDRPLPFEGRELGLSRPIIRTLEDREHGRLRLVLLPIQTEQAPERSRLPCRLVTRTRRSRAFDA
jgi:hypothetical protein